MAVITCSATCMQFNQIKKPMFPQVTALNKLKMLGLVNIVQHSYTVFIDRGFNYLVFEHLDRNLYSLVKQQPFNHLSLKAISIIVNNKFQQVCTIVFHSPLIIINIIHPLLTFYHHLMTSQLASALEELESNAMIHCDCPSPVQRPGW